MAYIAQSAIAGSVHQPANFAMVSNGPGSFYELEAESFGVGEPGVSDKEL